MKKVDDRISYYTRKVAQRSNHHPTRIQPRNFKFRSERLKLYKRLMHEQFKQEGYIK